eukprot:scpid108157/ scgid28320/ 
MEAVNLKPVGLKQTGMPATPEVRETVIDAGWPVKLSRPPTALQDLWPVRSSTLEPLQLLPRPNTAPEQCMVEVAPANPPVHKAVYERVLSEKMYRWLIVLLLVCFVLAVILFVYTLKLLIQEMK